MHTLRRIEQALTSRHGALACALLVWACTVLGLVWTPWLTMQSDSGWFMALGRSLAHGEGYAIDGVRHRAYPPVFPLMLAAVHSLSRGDYRPEKLVMVGLSLGVVLGSYWLFSQRFAGWRRLVLVVLMALSPSLVRRTAYLLTDVGGLCFAVLFVAAWNRFWRGPDRRGAFGAVALGALALGALTRLAGLFFYAACVAWLARPSVWRGERRRGLLFAALFLSIAVPAAVGWGLWVCSPTEKGSATYADYVRDDVLDGHSPLSAEGGRMLLAKLPGTMYNQVCLAARAVVGQGLGLGRGGWTLLLLPTLLVGVIWRMRRPEPQEYAFIAFSVLMILWPSPQGPRLWLPAVPLILGYLADGLERTAEWLARRVRLAEPGTARLRAGLLWTGAALLLVTSLASDVRAVRDTWVPASEPIGNVVFEEDQLDVARFVRDAGQRPIVVAYVRYLEVVPALRGMAARVVAIPFRAGSDAHSAMRRLADEGITHLAVSELTEAMGVRRQPTDAARSLVAALPERFRLVQSTPRVRIFEVVPARTDGD